jgi:hypothetical protein
MTKDIEYKQRLILHCIQLQEASLSNVRQTMDDAMQEAVNYGPPKDRYDGFRNQQLRRRDLYAKQLEQIAVNLRLLNNIDFKKKYNEAGFGALVITDQMPFLIAVGLGLVQFEGEDVAVISMIVPVYHAMKEKKAGESFTFNNKKYTVQQII